MPDTVLQSFARVSGECPCPICGRSDWCLVSLDGLQAVCQRVQSDAPWKNGFMHWITGDVKIPPPTNAAPRLSPETIKTLVGQWEFCAERFKKLPRLAGSLGVSVASLERMQVGWNERLHCYTFPMRDADFELVGARYRFANGDKRSLKGGSEGLFLPASTVGGSMLFAAEGPTDCAALLDCQFNAVGRPNNIGGVDVIAELVARFKIHTVVIVDDRDAAGSIGGDRLRDELITNSFVRILRIRPVRHKDARECVTAGGGRRAIMSVLRGGRNSFWSCLT